jgi:hypothetical protein
MTRANRFLAIKVDRPCLFSPTGNGGWCVRPTPADMLLPGRYRGEIVASEIVDCPAGKSLKVSWKVVGGHFDGRIVRQSIDYLHSNSKVQQIGQQQIKTICDATGLCGLLDTKDLHGARLLITVRLISDEPIVTEARELGALR